MRLRKILVYFKIEWQRIFEYRGDLIFYTLSSVTFPLIGLAIWLTASAGSDSFYGFSRTDLIIYFLLVMFVNILTGTWGAYFIANSINEGTFSNYLIRPYSLIWSYIANNISEKIFKVTGVSLLVLVLWTILIRSVDIALQFDLITFLLFLSALLMAVIISITMDIIIGLTAFWFHEIDFFRNTFNLVTQFFSGKIIPISFLPPLLYQTAVFLPFRYTLAFPIEILLNKVEGVNLLYGFGIQIVWLIILIFLYKVILSRGLKLYQGYGS